MKNIEYIAYSLRTRNAQSISEHGRYSFIQQHQIPSIIQNLHLRDLRDLRISTWSICRRNACREDIWDTRAQGFQEENLIKGISLRGMWRVWWGGIVRWCRDTWHFLDKKLLSSRGECEEIQTLTQVPIFFSIAYESNYTCRRIHKYSYIRPTLTPFLFLHRSESLRHFLVSYSSAKLITIHVTSSSQLPRVRRGAL